MYIYSEYWLVPKHNSFLEEERVAHIDQSFYQELYKKTSKLDERLARCLITSCSF